MKNKNLSSLKINKQIKYIYIDYGIIVLCPTLKKYFMGRKGT